MHLFILVAIAAISTAVQAFSINSLEEFDDPWLEEWPRSAVGSPGTPPPPTTTTEKQCIKDILIVMDVSESVGKSTFEDNIIPFLIALISNSDLNVGPDGTHIAIIIFSNKKNTRILLNFGTKTSRTDLLKYIMDLSWEKLKGDRTLTGRALQIANLKIFKISSPDNYRPGIADVIIILTDGEPRGPKGVALETKYAINNSTALKNKSVLIVGIAVGPKRSNFVETMRNMSSENSTFDVAFDKLDSIVAKLVNVSCKPFKPGDCICTNIRAADYYVKPSQTTKEIIWRNPKLTCKDDRQPKNVQTTVSPDVSSPHSFGLGLQRINYTYTFKKFELHCSVEFNIKTCGCPTTSPVVVYIKPGDNDVGVTWTVPKPPCPVIQNSVASNVYDQRRLGRGKYTVSYDYTTKAGFDLTCMVNIEVKPCDCPPLKTHRLYVKPDNPTRSFSWIVPKPICSGIQIIETTVTPPGVSPGYTFPLGREIVSYAYKTKPGFTLTCSVIIDVKVIPCQGQDYDPTTEVCCCGQLSKKSSGSDCCGNTNYDNSKEKCCPFYNLVPSGASCPGDEITV